MPSPYRHPYTWWEERLEGRERTADGFKAMCPSHPDNRPSLHVTRKASDKVPPVIHCFSGCDYSSVERAAREGVQQTDDGPSVKRSRTREAPEPVAPVPARWKGRGLAWWADHTGVSLEFVKTLPLREDGDLLLFTFPHNGIAKQRRIGEKKFTWNHPGVSAPPLWPMPEDELPPTIYLTEGESDCTNAREMLLPAYAITKGANTSLPPAVWRTLKDRGVKEVVLMFDQDEAGEKAMEQYQADGTAQGFVVSTCRPPLRILEGEKDLTDWRKRTHGTKDDLLVEGVTAAFDLDALAISSPPDTVWTAPGYFARDAITLVAGPPKAGKSTLIADFLRCHEQGCSFLGVPVRKGKALLMTEEFAPTILEKAQTFGLQHVAVLTQGHANAQGWTFTDALARAVAQAKREHRDVLVIDTLSAWAQFKDENDAAEITQALTAVRNTVANSGIAVILIHHTRKGGGEHGEAIRGSSALFALTEIAIEYSYKDRTTRAVTVSSRFAHSPDVSFVQMSDSGRLEVLDKAEWNELEATPVVEALQEGPKGMQELIVATSLSDATIRKHLRNLEAIGRVDATTGARGRKTYTIAQNGQQGGASFKVNVRRRAVGETAQRPSDGGVRGAADNVVDIHRSRTRGKAPKPGSNLR